LQYSATSFSAPFEGDLGCNGKKAEPKQHPPRPCRDGTLQVRELMKAHLDSNDKAENQQGQGQEGCSPSEQLAWEKAADGSDIFLVERRQLPCRAAAA